MLNQIINMVMRQVVRQGVNSAMKGGSSLMKSQIEKRSKPTPPAPEQAPQAQKDPNAPDT